MKRAFSQDPIDYEKLRKSDEKTPPSSYASMFSVEVFQVGDTSVTSISPREWGVEDKLVLLFPGGAFVSGPVKHHWSLAKRIAKETGSKVWLIDYPKAPEFNIREISNNIDRVYSRALELHQGKLVLLGDSVGATLITSLVQRLEVEEWSKPSKLILITPVFDSSMTNSKIEDINPRDPLLNRIGVVSAKRMCADGVHLKDTIISPLYGRFDGFPETLLLCGGNDIMSPDALKVGEMMKQSGVELTLVFEPDMPHIYPLLPFMPASRKALRDLIFEISYV